MPLIENAFIFGVSTKEPSEIILNLSVDEKG
jgi:sensor histidine kinase YesM